MFHKASTDQNRILLNTDEIMFNLTICSMDVRTTTYLLKVLDVDVSLRPLGQPLAPN